MSEVDENPDLMALKKLLISWHVGELFDLFKEEDIAINELKMMDYKHIHSLLKDYKMGIKIRFEYNLKNWRQKLGIPLKSSETDYQSNCCSINRANWENKSTENTTTTDPQTFCDNGAKRARFDINEGATKKDCTDERHALLSPQSVTSNQSLINILDSEDVFNFGSLQESTNEKAFNNDNEIDMANLPLQALGELLSISDGEKPKFPSKITPEKFSVDLKQILKESDTRAAIILKFFQEKNRLTNVHRSQLIQLIVDYFIENDYHLSLNLSHNLEWEILKMFPTEKLEYYRTEKRGKIYAKFSNMKRYKRERSIIKVSREGETLRTRRSRQKTEENEANSTMNSYDENWYPTAEPEIVVKEENGDEDEKIDNN